MSEPLSFPQRVIGFASRAEAYRLGGVDLAGAGVWPIYRHCTRESWLGDWPAELASLSPSNPLPAATLILGPVGCGKTHVATALLAAWLAAGRRGLWRDVGELLREIKATFRRDDEPDPTERLRTCELLVLDDLGAEQPTEWSESAIGQLLRFRHGYQRRTIVTTNLSGAEIEPRVASRISAGLVVRLAGKDMRRDPRVRAVEGADSAQCGEESA